MSVSGPGEEIYGTTPRFGISRTGFYGPSDEAITSYIDHYLDPQKAFKHLHVKWKKQILAGRNNFHGLLERHDRLPLPPLYRYPQLVSDPPSRTEQRRDFAYRSHCPIARERHEAPMQDFQGIFLSPTGRSTFSSDFHLLSVEMMEGHVIPWSPGPLRVQGGLEWSPGQVEWTRFVLCRMGVQLKKARLFGGVALALFEYSWGSNLVKAMATNCNYVHNTFVLEDRDATIDLQQMSRLLGVLVEGLFYEERVPCEEELYGFDHRGLPVHSDALRRVFRIYYEIAMSRSYHGLSRDVPFRDWIGYFMDRVSEHDAAGFASPLEPIMTGSDMTYIPLRHVEFSDLSTLSLDDETILTAYIAWWLCYFLVTCEPAGHIRPGVFVVANALARGGQFALAIPALVNLYRSMREFTSLRDPSRATTVIPLHTLHGWFYLHWERCFVPLTSAGMRRSLPALIHIAGCTI